MKKEKLKIAIQKKGRLSEASLNFLNSLGLTFIPNGRSLIQKCKDQDIDLILLREDDIPEYVGRGIVDFGIIGKNTFFEEKVSMNIMRELNFAKCVISIAVPEHSVIKTSRDLEGERIATTYPVILKNYLKENQINAAIIPIAGSAEIAPELNLADAICDVVQTGNTLRAHNLKPLIKIMDLNAILIGNDVVKKGKEELKKILMK